VGCFNASISASVDVCLYHLFFNACSIISVNVCLYHLFFNASIHVITSLHVCAYSGGFTCDICNVHVNSQEILNVHLSGQKHKSKAAREKLLSQHNDKDKIVPEGGLVVEGYSRFKPGMSISSQYGPWSCPLVQSSVVVCL